MKTAIAPAIKKAGIRQVTTWAARYSMTAFNPERSAPVMASVMVVLLFQQVRGNGNGGDAFISFSTKYFNYN
ncbi:MAG: hypothetical protein A4E41_01644 [Methanoregulaceae archaeon PtaU1.Bin066]|nr:MAG: hypothetical protein A4E41_01644 [Methanoregulaceae archaeon PtaU1.Bin066]